MADNTALPSGFTLDQPQAASAELPAGFTLDEPKKTTLEIPRAEMLPVGVAETGISMATGGLAQAAGGLAGLAQGAYNVGAEALGGKPGMSAADRVTQIQQAGTYQPRTEAGKQMTGALSVPFQYLEKGAQAAGGYVAEKTGSPAAGAVTETVIQAAPYAVMEGLKAPRVAKVPEAGGVGAQATEHVTTQVDNYAKQHGIDLTGVSTKVRSALEDIAKSGGDLSNLPPEAVARQARLEALGIPATRGQLTRNIAQITKEENVSRAEAGGDIMKIKTDQDVRLGDLISTLKRETGATAETREQTGKSVQNALREKKTEIRKEASNLYDVADRFGEMGNPVDVTPLYQFLKADPAHRRFTDVESLLKDYAPKEKEPAAPKAGTATPEVTGKPNPENDSILRFMAKHKMGLSTEDAIAQGIDPSDIKNNYLAYHGIKRAFRKGGQTFDAAAETLSQYGYPVTDKFGRYDPNVLLDRIQDELMGRPHYSAEAEIGLRFGPEMEEAQREMEKSMAASKEAEPKYPVTVKELEQIRQALRAEDPTTQKGFYSKKAVAVIDYILDENGSPFYKEARAKWHAYKAEFDRQTAVKKLVTEKGMSSDRAVALEDTVDHILRAPSEDIAKIKKALTEGGSDVAQRRGAQAWSDVRGAVVDKLREAANKDEITGEAGQLQINSGFNRLFKQLDKDGKIDQIFTKPQAAQLRRVSQAIADVRTTPSARISGSSTAANTMSVVLSLLDKIPQIGGYVTGAVTLAKKVGKVGERGRIEKEAMISPLEEAAKKAKKTVKRKETAATLKELSREIAPIAPYTLKDMDQNQ